jgi:GrpB-like predicted nucleotidyltransferase (UPF0157 family)
MHMVTADNFVTELDAKNQTSIERLIASLVSGVAKEAFEIPDVLRLIMKASIEAAEVAALWLSDCDDLEMKLLLAEQCGDGAKQYRHISARLSALAADVAGYDPRHGGYSKVFAFLRSLQTPEERSSAGFVTAKAFAMARLETMAVFCEGKGDLDSARLLRDELAPLEQRYYEEGKRILSAAAATEESQARGRRAAYRTLELAADMHEPIQLRKILLKRR